MIFEPTTGDLARAESLIAKGVINNSSRTGPTTTRPWLTRERLDSMHLTVPRESIEPLIREIVSQVIDDREQAGAGLKKQLYPLAEAATVLGLTYDRLREEIGRGRISKLDRPGAKQHYISKKELIRYLSNTDRRRAAV